MLGDRPQADRILVAQLTGEARHHARWRDLTATEHAAAMRELRKLASGRADLLAEVAGIFEGTSEGDLGEPLARQAAQLCRDAGADPTLSRPGSRKDAADEPQPSSRHSVRLGGGLRGCDDGRQDHPASRRSHHTAPWFWQGKPGAGRCRISDPGWSAREVTAVVG